MENNRYKGKWKREQCNFINLKTDGECKNLEELIEKFNEGEKIVYNHALVAIFYSIMAFTLGLLI